MNSSSSCGELFLLILAPPVDKRGTSTSASCGKDLACTCTPERQRIFNTILYLFKTQLFAVQSKMSTKDNFYCRFSAIPYHQTTEQPLSPTHP